MRLNIQRSETLMSESGHEITFCQYCSRGHYSHFLFCPWCGNKVEAIKNVRILPSGQVWKEETRSETTMTINYKKCYEKEVEMSKHYLRRVLELEAKYEPYLDTIKEA